MKFAGAAVVAVEAPEIAPRSLCIADDTERSMLSFLSTALALAPSPLGSSTSSTTNRRAILTPAVAAAFSAVVPPLAANAADLKTYSDKRYDVSFGVPDGWEATPQELADGRRLVVRSQTE